MNSILVILAFVIAAIDARDIITIISSDIRPSGTIFSKGFPYSYNSTEPEVFHFRGHEDEKVQITFEKFSLYPKSTVNQRCGYETSFISYKKTLRSNELERFCGDEKPLPIMSEGEEFILRYEPIVVPSNSPLREANEEIGFNATFRFVKNYGIEYKMPQNDQMNKLSSYCEFTYDSVNFPNGTFSSPNFPGAYPTNIQCYYSFTGQESKIIFQFTHFNLLGSTNCSTELEKRDKLRILTSSDEIMISEKNKEYCGSQDPFEVEIENGTAFIIFQHQASYSDNELAKYPFVGFNAYFRFTNTTDRACDCELPGILIASACLYLILHQRQYY